MCIRDRAEVPLFGMVKDDHHRTRAMVDSEGREIAINMNRGTFTFITAIQDETHRFANAYRCLLYTSPARTRRPHGLPCSGCC